MCPLNNPARRKKSRTDVSLGQNQGPGQEPVKSCHEVERWVTAPN